MSTTQYLTDASTRHQVFLERYGNGQSKEATELLYRIRRDINARLSRDPTDFQKARLNSLLMDVEKIAADGFKDIELQQIAATQKLAVSEGQFSVSLFNKAATIDFVSPTAEALMAATMTSGMVSQTKTALTIEEALQQFGKKKSKQIAQTIADGIVLGDTTAVIADKVGGMINTLHRRQLNTLVHTIANHTSSVARGQVYYANEDIIDGFRWVATLDSRTTIICGSRDGKVFQYGSDPMPPAHWNCVLGDTLITSANGISAVFKRVFKGEVVTINTVSGNKLTVTPNHPILTSNGWVSAHLVNVGDKCFNQSSCKGVGSVDGDNDRGFVTAEDVFESFGRSSNVVSGKVEISSPDFHGDAFNDEVAEVRAARDLSVMANTSIIKHGGDCVFGGGYMPFIDPSIHSGGVTAFLLEAPGSSSGCNIGISGDGLLFDGGASIHPGLLLSGSTPDDNTVLSENTLNGTWADAEHIRNASDSYAGGVFLDDVISVERSYFCGHVYNLQTIDSCYSANGIITHNCRSTTIPAVKPEYDMGAKVQGERPSIGADGVEQVNAKTTYGGWLKRQPREFVDEALGVERSRLFRSGKLKLDKFVDPTGRVYTLEQLERMNPLVFAEK